jgi:hypothetical protein
MSLPAYLYVGNIVSLERACLFNWNDSREYIETLEGE